MLAFLRRNFARVETWYLWLPQFMPNAKITLLLLMVMVVTALCSTPDYVIMLKSPPNKALHITPGGKVSAADISIAQNITIGHTDFIKTGFFAITFYSKEAGRYLCFNKHWRLVGMKHLKERCYFVESLDLGYSEFRSAVDRSHRVGFTRRLRPLGPVQTQQDLTDACFYFIKEKPIDVSTAGRKAIGTVKHNRRNNQQINKTNNNGHNSTLNNDSTSIKNNNRLSQTSNNNNNKITQPRILVRHHHAISSIVARRRQHQREQKIRQNRKHIQNNGTTSPSINLSAKSSSTMLAPSMLNIVATLAASRQTRGRRKNDSRDDDEENRDDAKVEKQKQTPILSGTEPPLTYLSPENTEHHRHRHHHHLMRLHSDGDGHGRDGSTLPPERADGQPKTTDTSGLLQFSNEYSNNNMISSNNYIAIPALPKNLYNSNNNLMTEYVYNGSTYVKNKNNLSDNISNSGSYSEDDETNNHYNIDNNFKDYLKTFRHKDSANRKTLFETIKKSNNKIKNIVQYRYAVSFIWTQNSMWYYLVVSLMSKIVFYYHDELNFSNSREVFQGTGMQIEMTLTEK